MSSILNGLLEFAGSIGLEQRHYDSVLGENAAAQLAVAKSSNRDQQVVILNKVRDFMAKPMSRLAFSNTEISKSYSELSGDGKVVADMFFRDPRLGWLKARYGLITPKMSGFKELEDFISSPTLNISNKAKGELLRLIKSLK